MEEIPKEYDFKAVEEKWIKEWRDEDFYFDFESDREPYVIDTPPPYPTGNFHVGNALNWCYIDFIARYKRLKGYNVMFPQGWDCHGLPTEVKVEELYGITKKDVSREEFRRLCRELTMKNIEKMKATMRRLGFSIDWSNEYITMLPEYYSRTQKSFVRMFNDGWIYRDEHPVNWCPRCETAIAFAEVEYEERETTLYYVHFDGIDIATTRPELMSACVAVAVHPEDERYSDLIGKKVRVPLWNLEVPVIADEEVDPNFGTGAVMICTFGDRQDVRWWKKYRLPLRRAISRDGRMTEIAGKYAGMKIEEAKKEIVEDLRKEGRIFKEERIKQNVGLCWRCDTPIEILSETQWFVKVDKERILKRAREIKWVPEHMRIRLENWVSSMEWDWCISRQRIFATPIPVWYCKKCGKVKVAKEEWLPVDPTRDSPREPCECGSMEFEGEEDVLDTWMDSSISALWVAGWDRRDKLLLPTQLRPQGHDIIRTWAFYTILRTDALVQKIPWHTIVINGMVLGEDGHKMSKSLGNIIDPEEVIEKYGADAFRQWAALGGATGSDIMFRWKDVIAARRFEQKLWSIFRFSYPHLKKGEAGEMRLTPVDHWLLRELKKVEEEYEEAMENFRFNEAFQKLKNFTWEILADEYIEAVKHRLYEKGDRTAAGVLSMTLRQLLLMMSPFIPFITEEIYTKLFGRSIHKERFEKLKVEIDEKLASEGERAIRIIAAIRRYKSERGIPLNAPLKKIIIYGDVSNPEEIRGATNSEVEIRKGQPEFERRVKAVKPKMSVIGPKYRERAKKIISFINSSDPENLLKAIQSGNAEIEKGLRIEMEDVEVEYELVSGGREVDVMEEEGALIVIEK
ncbi:MAG: valine--tRNA ligase [Archaeoglobi archaeon]|nr:valine--tRNA ligase [Candidatus Mnemosynella bozhongmuii]